MPELQTTNSPEPKAKSLYSFLSQEGYDLGDFGTFDIKLQDAKLRKQFYTYFRGEGYDLGELPAFEAKVKKTPFDQPAIPAGFVSPEPQSPFEKFFSGAKETVSDVEKYIGEQVLAPPVLKAKRAISGVLPESVRKLTGFEMTPEQLKKAEEIGAPAIPLSRLAPSQEEIEKLPTPYKRLASIGKGALEVAEGLTTAENIALISALGGAPKAVQSAISAGFAYLMGKELPNQWKAFKEAKTEAEKIRLATHAAATLGFTAAAAKHAVTGIKGAIEERKIGKEREKVLPELERAGMEAEAVTRIAEREKAARAEQQKYEPVTAEEIRKRAVMDITDLNAKLAKGEKLHPNDQKALDFLKTNLENHDALARAYRSRVESPEIVQAFRQEKAARQAQESEAIQKQQEAAKKIEQERIANLETTDLQLQALAEQLATDKLKKPYESLSLAEKNRIDNLSGAEYQKRLRQIAKGLQIRNPELRTKESRQELEAQASEILRQQLVNEKNARQAKVEPPTAEPSIPAAETRLERRALELSPEDVEIIPPPEPVPPAEIAAPPETIRWRLTTPVAGELPGVTETTTPAVELRRGEYVGEVPETRIPAAGRTQERKAAPGTTPPAVAPPQPPASAAPAVTEAETPAQMLAERKQKFAENRQALIERKLEFAKRQQEERERLAEEKAKQREEIKAKLATKYRISELKEAPKTEKAHVTAETTPITGKETTGQPQVEPTTTETAPISAARPVEPVELRTEETTAKAPEKLTKAASPVEAPRAGKEPWEMTKAEYIASVKSEIESTPERIGRRKQWNGLQRILKANESLGRRKGLVTKEQWRNFVNKYGYPENVKNDFFHFMDDPAHLGKIVMESATTEERQHYNAVVDAAGKGKPVPDEVLADYPDLRREVAAEAKLPEAPQARTSPVKPEIVKLRPSEQLRRAQKIYDKIQKTGDWQDRVKAELENAGYPDNIVKFFSEPERRVRPSEPFGISTATTREGRAERASEPPTELKESVDAIADIGRRNQIAQARYDAARKELLNELQKLDKEGVIVKLDEKTGGYQISIRDPQALTEKTKAIIKKIQQAEIDKGSYAPEMIATELQISVAPGAEVLKGLGLKGTLAEKVLETIKRKVQAKKTQADFDKIKSEYKDDLVDYYFNRNAPEQGTSLLGKTKEGLPTEVLIRRAPSVKGAGDISVEAQQAIQAAKDIDRAQVDAGTSLLESSPSREAWNDQMVAKFGEQIKPRLDDIHSTTKYIQENKFVEIRSISKAMPETAAKKGFEFIRTKLSDVDQAKFDALLDNIKATDVEILGKANDFGTVLAGTAKQYANYAEFGYWTLKAFGRAGVNKAAWAAEMVKGLGERIKPFIDDLWDKINSSEYKPGQEFSEADLPKFNANTIKAKTEKVSASLPDDNPLPVIKGAKRPTPFIGAYVESVVRTIERISPKAATGFRQAIDYWELQEGKGQALINPLARKLRFKPTALNRLDEISRTDGISMWDNWHEWLKNPETMPRDLTMIERQAVEIYRKLLDDRKKVLQEAGREKVEQLAFKRVPSFDLLDAIRSESGSVWNALVKELSRLNDLPVEKVANYLKRYRLEKFEKFPTHIRIGEGKFSDVVPVLATQGMSALRALNRDTSRLAGVTKVFGEDYSSTFKEIRKSLPANFQSDFDLARDAYFGVRRLDNSRNLGKRLLLNLAQPVIRTALLARAAVQQPTQALAATRLVTGKTLLRGFYDLAKKGTKAELEAISAYAPAILDLAWQKGQRIEDFGRIASEIGGNISLLKPAIELTDLGVSAAFRRFALDIKERGGKLRTREKNTLEVLNFTPEQINLIDKKGFEGYKDADVMYSALINRGRKAVTFTGLKGPERTKFQLNPLISSLIQFQGFNIGQMQQAAGVAKNISEVWRSIGKAQTPEAKKSAQMQMASAIKQAGILFGATFTAAEANIFMKSLINGQDHDRPEDFNRLIEDLVETGWIPFLREFSYGFASDPSKVILPNNVVNEMVDAWKARGKYKDYEGWERAAIFLDRYAVKPYSQTFYLPKNFLIATGLLEGNPTLKTATNYYWDFLKDNGEFKASEREGYNEVQAVMREITNTIKESEVGTPVSQLMPKIKENVLRALRAKREELIEQKRMNPAQASVEASRRIRQSLVARQTLTKFYDKKIGKFKIGEKYYNREELGDALRGSRYSDALFAYDRLLKEIADSL